MSTLEFENQVIKSIHDGDIHAFRKLYTGKIDIDRNFSISKDILVKNNSNSTPFPFINNPTPLVLAILCEKAEIVEYILKEKNPNLNKRVNGWNAIHYASCTVDYQSLKHLLAEDFYSMNIDIEVQYPFTVPSNNRTTSLHIAVTNNRHAQALMLLFPYLSHQKYIENDSLAPANPKQPSAHGNMPIHIAARNGDWDMHQILLHASDDITITNDQGKTPIDILREYEQNEIISLISNMVLNPFDDLVEKYIKQTISNTQIANQEPKSIPAVTYRDDLMDAIINLTRIIQNIDTRVERLEKSERFSLSDKKIIPETMSIKCSNCDSNNATLCLTCNKYLCDQCMISEQHLCYQ